MNQRVELFTPNYAVTYYGWEKSDLIPVDQFRSVYVWCNYYVYVWSSNYYQLIKITDNTGKLLFEGYINTIPEFKKLVKKLNLSCPKNCTENIFTFIIDEKEDFITDENDNYLTE